MRSTKHPKVKIQFFKTHDEFVKLPLLSCTVSAGFPSPADDHLDKDLDIVDLLIKRPAATFFLRAKGSSMQGVGVCNGDYLIVDKSVNPIHGSMVVAAVDGECLVKIFCRQNKRIWLQSANPQYPPLYINDDKDFQLWGVVTGIMRQHGNNGRVCVD